MKMKDVGPSTCHGLTVLSAVTINGVRKANVFIAIGAHCSPSTEIGDNGGRKFTN